MLKRLLVLGGLLSFVLGAIGVVLPLLPTTPFLLLAGYCFARGSDRFDRWLKATKLYQAYVGDYLETRTIPLKKKFKIILNIYLLMGISIYFVPFVPAKIVLLLMTVAQTIALFFFVPTRVQGEQRKVPYK